MNKPSRASLVVVVALLGIGAAARLPMRVPPSEWPLERIVRNLEQAVSEAPENGMAHYCLGRAFAFAFALERSSLWTSNGRYVEELGEQRKRFAGAEAGARTTPREALDRLTGGIHHLRRACEIDAVPAGFQGDPAMLEWCDAREHLTLAWLLETGAHLASRVNTPQALGLGPPVLTRGEQETLEQWIDDLESEVTAVAEAAQRALASPEHLERSVTWLDAQRTSTNVRRQKAVTALLERYWIERAIAEYWLAYEQNIELELSIEGWELDRLVSYEALLGYERLVRKRGVRSPEEEARLVDLAEKRKRLEAHPSGEFITPLLLSLDECEPLDELIAPNFAVPFDLDGDGIDELWPWIAPGTGWLVWDPERRGEITSGRQLFGSASAWLFFEDGYRVLDALDDDRSGELRGPELTGIAVWFDRDTDGVSDRGEVVPVEELGIVALATESTLHVGPSPANLCGLELADGRVLPTYDWVLTSVPGTQAEPHE